MNLTQNQQEALNINNHICVTAGAGSGKTTVLVDRYLKILEEGEGNIIPRDIVAITFTEKAAAEMKGRIINQLTDATDLTGREVFLEEMNVAPISTIHAFCSSILREFPFQAGVPANFNIIQGIDQKLLLKQIIHNILREVATDSNDRHYSDLQLSLQRFGNRQKLVDLFVTMVEKRDVVNNSIYQLYENLDCEGLYEIWCQQINQKFITSLKPLLAIACGPNADVVREYTHQLENIKNVNDTYNLRIDIVDLITTKSGSIGKTDFIGRGVDITDYKEEIKYLESASKIIKNAKALDEDNTGTFDHYLIKTTQNLLALYKRILVDYQSNKLLQSTLDFNDLQIKTRDLLKNRDEIRKILLERYKYYMIDEYQDTNEIQYELVMLLTNELQDANLFIVGDPKQSIFAFRGADVRVFDKTKQKIINNNGMDIQLTENFRSLRDTVGFVNHFFHSLMGNGSKNEFEVEYEPLTLARTSDGEGTVEIILGQQDNEATNESVIIAHHINKMISNNEQIWERGEDGEEIPRPINYGDIAILIRSRSHLPDIEHALLAADIPYLTTGGIGFYQRQEIYDIWNYLNFLNSPDLNDTALVGILRGPAFGISDTELYEISRQQVKGYWEKTNNYSSPSDQLQKAIATILVHLQYAHRMPINQLIQKIVNETGIIGTLNLGKQGQQRIANYQKLIDLARDFDGDENKHTLSDFIEFLDILINEEPREGQAPIENTSGAVEIMTVHSAKGKQFPVVILSCLHRGGMFSSEPYIDVELGIGFSLYQPEDEYTKSVPEIVNIMKDRASTKDDAEKKRLLYVGATRAEDRLILSGSLNRFYKLDKLLKWVYEHLGIEKEDDSFSKQVAVNTYLNNQETYGTFDLNIPIHKRIIDIDDEDKISNKIVDADYPDFPLELTISSAIDTSLSVTELANYVRCPQRYQLEHLLQIPISENGQSEENERDLDNIIRNVLAQKMLSSSSQNVNTLIDHAISNYTDVNTDSSIARLKEISNKHINNFRDSQLGQISLSSTEKYINYHIKAETNGHIISGKIDRLFKDLSGLWQGINYISQGNLGKDYYQPEIELLGLLIHQSFPEQPIVTINYFFTELGECLSMSFNSIDFQEISEKCNQEIISLQENKFTKNTIQCIPCPYSDSIGQCIVK